MIGPGKPLLAGLDKKMVEDIINCPLKIVYSYPNIIHDLKERIHHSVGLHYVIKSI